MDNYDAMVIKEIFPNPKSIILVFKKILCISEAGASSTFKSLASGSPIIFTHWAGYNEKGNIDFCLKNKIGSAIVAEELTDLTVYCIICDSDINRAWVSKYPKKSRIVYFAPCNRKIKRLKEYGVR